MIIHKINWLKHYLPPKCKVKSGSLLSPGRLIQVTSSCGKEPVIFVPYVNFCMELGPASMVALIKEFPKALRLFGWGWRRGWYWNSWARTQVNAAAAMRWGLLHPSDRSMSMGKSFGKREEFNLLRNVWFVMFEMSMSATSCGLRQSLHQFIWKLDWVASRFWAL